MNYPNFLKKVDQLTSASDVDSLRSFIHEIARTIPESNRQRFLATLDRFSSVSADKPISEEVDACLTVQVDSLLKALEEIQTGDRELESEYNEEWDDWQDEAEDAYRFSDPDNLLDDIAAAVKALHQCLDQEEYAKGAELAKALSELTVHIIGDCDEDEMGIRVLAAYDLLDVDLEKTIKEAVYLTCTGTQEAGRAEAMLEILDQFGDYSISLEDILQAGSDEIALDSLLPSWIEALAKRPARKTDWLLAEAQNMLQDKKAVLDNASRYAESHPILYHNILRTGIDDASPEEMLQIGLRAMKEVPASHSIRSGISLLTAKYALAAQNRQTAETCWMEAFRTSPTVENFLRLRLETRQWENIADDAREIYTAYYESKSSWDQMPLAALMFFDEQFEKMTTRFMKAGKGIGWSSTFMKEGIALMLLLLDSGAENRPGMSAMRDKAIYACSFKSDSYCEGTDLEPGTPTAVLFRDCFQRWKNDVELPESVCESWLKKIDKWVALRVAAIMDANRRNYYGECAAFVAAYGEVLESRGKPGEKDRIMQQYKMEYSRRRAFHDELRKFGMRK